MRFSSRHVVVGCFLTLVAVPSLGCRKMISDFLEKPEESARASERKGVDPFSDPHGATTAPTPGSGKVPADFPKSIPIYPGATITNGGSTTDDGTKMMFVGLQTKDSPDKVAAFYKANFDFDGEASDYFDSNDVANNPIAGITRVLSFKDAASGTDVSATIQAIAGNGAAIQLNATK